MPSCVACGQENPPVARFCLSCGSSMAEAGRSVDERRIVTIIFVDLVGFTGRAEKLDPEDVQALLAPYHHRVRREIESFGGTVEKFIGDAVMGVFGAPVAHGDDAERAVRAALAVRDIAGELAGGDLQLRIAVNTGEAVVSLAARAALGEALVAGDVVNTAARLQTAAPINGVIVGFETFLATRDLIRYEPTEPVVAKGKQHPVQAWIAVEPRHDSGLGAVDSEGIVGRSLELAILNALWERSVAARLPTLVSVIGPPGVGKSTIAAEFVRIATDSGARVVYGRSLPYRESGAYGALAGQLMRLADVYESDPPDVVADKLRASAVQFLSGQEADPETLADDLAAIVGTSSGPAANDREALFHSVRDFLEGAVREHPTILVFEDIHWAGANMLDVVLALAALMRDVPICLLTLARPELIDARPDWGSGAPDFFGLTLGPLDEVHSRELVSRSIGDVAQAEAVLATAEGNPLFIAQLAASIGEIPSGRLPTNIREIVAARLDALPQAERVLLLDAAVVGRVFWLDALRALNQDNDVPRLLEQLERRDLIRRDTGSIFEGKTQFVFTHALIREVAYEMLPRAERTRRHAMVAEFFEQTAGASSEALGALARHWLAAGEHERAMEHLLRAAEVAERGWAKDHAAYLYREALALIPAEETERRRAVQRKLALASAASLHAPDVRRAGNRPA